MLHVSGLHLDLYTLLRFVFTAIAIGFGLLHLVKRTASKYFVVDANFDEAAAVGAGGRGAGGESSVGGSKMITPAAAPVDGPCAICGVVTKKRCSTCKSVRYCSHNCQSKHWRDGHKFKCRKASTCDSNAKGHQLKKVLFPYEEFVRLYNWEKTGFPPCGLLNFGNSCFANVVLQCLSCTRPLIAYLLEKDHRRECRRNDWCFLCELQLHVERAKLLQPFSPINILSRLPNIGGNLGYGKQEDAHEFMRFVIDTMQSVCLDEFGGEKVLHPSSQETTLIQYTFGGHLQSQVACTKCNKISYRYENMMDLTVEIQGDAASLEDCLVLFTAEEWLDGENMYKCDGCNDYVKACKRLTIHQAPNILTIALKRFQSGRFGKLNKRVTFPETLDLGPYMSKQGHGTDLYQLYAVVVHVDMLNASYFGHYICYTKDLRGKWYRVDDCKVMTVELEEVLAQGAYMLLYSRTSVRPTFVNLLETSSKDDRRPVEAVKEVEIVKAAEPCQEQLVEPMATEGPTDSVAIVNMTSDTELLSKESVSKNEVPVCMDMDDPLNVSLELTGEADSDTSLHDLVKIKSRPEDTVDMDVDDAFKINFMSDRQDPLERGLSNPQSTSGASRDSDDHGSEQSHPIRMASSADNAYSLESKVSGTNNSDECSFDNGNEVEGINNKEFMSLERPLDCSLENKSDIHGMASTSLPCACLNSVTNVPHESSRSFEGPTDPMLDQEKGSVKKNSVAQNGKAPSSAEENSCSQVKMKPLFSSGFLDKRRRSGSSDRNAKALARSREVGLICKTGNNVNGFTKPGARDNGSDCDSKPNSSSIEKQSEQCNGDEIINIELVDRCNGRSHAAEIVDPAKLVNGGCSSSDMECTSGDATEACNSCSEEFVQPESVTLCSNQADCETNQESSTAPVDISCSDAILLDGSNLDSSHSQHPGLEQVVSVGSGNGHSALRTSEVKSLGATRKGNWSKAKLNPLFSAGFLDKRPGLKPQNSNGNPEIGDGEASNLFEVSNSNGFANASFQVSDHDRMANCNSSNSPNLVKIQCKGNGPNVTKKSNEELGEGGNIQKIQCNGNGKAVDINGNSAILNDPARGIVRGDQKNLFSRGFLDRSSPKKVIKKVGEDRGMTETVLSEHDCDKQRRAG